MKYFKPMLYGMGVILGIASTIDCGRDFISSIKDIAKGSDDQKKNKKKNNKWIQ